MPPYCFCPAVVNDHGYNGYTSARARLELRLCRVQVKTSIRIPYNGNVYARIGNTGTSDLEWSILKESTEGRSFGPITGVLKPGEEIPVVPSYMVPSGGIVSLTLKRVDGEYQPEEVCTGFGVISDRPLE